MPTKKELVKVAKELNEALGLDPEIPTSKIKKDELEDLVAEASTMVVPADELTASTQAIVDKYAEVDEEATEESKEKDRWTLLAEAADELNESLGLEPKIPVTDISEVDLEEKLKEITHLIDPDDELSEQTTQILSELEEEFGEEEEFEDDEEFFDKDEEFEDEEFEDEFEDEFEEDEEFEEEFEDDEELIDLDEYEELINSTSKRKELKEIAKDDPDLFGPVIKKFDKLKSGAALQGALLKHLDTLKEEFEEKDEIEADEVEKTKTKSDTSKDVYTSDSADDDSSDNQKKAPALKDQIEEDPVQLFIEEIKEEPKTMADIQRCDWNKTGASFNTPLKKLINAGLAERDDEYKIHWLGDDDYTITREGRKIIY